MPHYRVTVAIDTINLLNFDATAGNLFINPASKARVERMLIYALLEIIQPMVKDADTEEECIIVKEQISVVLRLRNLPNIPCFAQMSIHDIYNKVKHNQYFVVKGCISTLWEETKSILCQTYRCSNRLCNDRGYLSVTKKPHEKRCKVIKRTERAYFSTVSISMELHAIDAKCSGCNIEMGEAFEEPEQYIALTQDLHSPGAILKTALIKATGDFSGRFSLGEEIMAVCEASKWFDRKPLLGIEFMNEFVTLEMNNLVEVEKKVYNGPRDKLTFRVFEEAIEHIVPFGMWKDLKDCLLLRWMFTSSILNIDDEASRYDELIDVLVFCNNFGPHIQRLIWQTSRLTKCHVWGYGSNGRKNQLDEKVLSKEKGLGYIRGDTLSLVDKGILIVDLNTLADSDLRTIQEYIHNKREEYGRKTTIWAFMEEYTAPKSKPSLEITKPFFKVSICPTLTSPVCFQTDEPIDEVYMGFI
ncbi:hypothetical protein DSO57_1022206 [Entomophthora muscae]|uniref:Uncharacterized protein n=1 Tax=Entomophthora muscae TaxID=34485 RepID=A0ACC2T327_9FUNG|nr:hypothetical protein DSO57_1022206 [Entomophthora muscae]